MVKKFTKMDMPLLGRAYREKWNIPDSTKNKIVESMDKIISDDSSKISDKAKAADIIIKANKQNIEVEKIMQTRVTVTEVTKLTDEQLQLRIDQLQQELEALNDSGRLTA